MNESKVVTIVVEGVLQDPGVMRVARNATSPGHPVADVGFDLAGVDAATADALREKLIALDRQRVRVTVEVLEAKGA